MKKIIILSVLLALSLFSFNCGGGSGSSDSPKGENPGVPSIVQLLPSHYIAQTNSIITLHAKVLDGNGAPVNNIPVSFTNLSSIGALSAISANTNNNGIASVTIKSTTTGFSTVQVEVNKGVAQVRDRKTVYFSTNLNLQPYMILDVDGDDDGNYNEISDVNLFETAADNQVVIRATVFDRFGERAAFTRVTFGADWPYRVGTAEKCSDGSDICEVNFPFGNNATTNINGEAFVLVRVDPLDIRNIQTILTITAEADNGAYNMVSLFPQPVIIETIDVYANPQTVASGGSSTITARVLTNAGNPVPDGTTVNFSVSPASNGGIEPFMQTTDGFAEAKFTAAAVTSDTSATIRASAGGASDTVAVTITAPVTPPPALTVTPTTASVRCTEGGDRIFVVAGGVPPYRVTSANPNVTLVGASGTPPAVTINASGGSFTARVAAGSCSAFPVASTAVPLVVTDRVSTVTSATLTVTNP